MLSLRIRTLCRPVIAIALVIGLVGSTEAGTPNKLRPYSIVNRAAPNAGSYTWAVPQLCKAYNFPQGLNGGGVIGILELGGGWSQSDLDIFSAINNLPTINVTDISVDGTTNNYGVDSNADIEVALDIQVAAAAYYYATGKMPTIKVFFAQNNFNSFKAVIQAAVAANCDVLSISWGAPESSWQQGAPGVAQQLEAAAIAASASGLAIFAAAGDNSSGDGSFFGNAVDVPAACPHIIGCGGTNKTRTSETVWGDGFSSDSGTGGGYSTIFPVQSFQFGAPKAPKGLGRMVPDVAADADPNTGVLIIYSGFEYQVGGTSGVSPLYSGFFAALGKKPGFVTPKLWQNQAAFVDIKSGSNGGYKAAFGPDACTGLGVPNGVSITKLFVNYTPPPPPPSPKVTVSFSNGTLTVTGDNLNDSIVMTYKQTKVSGVLKSASVTIASGTNNNGDPATLVNNSANPVEIQVGVSRFNANIQMGTGSDSVVINSFFANNVTVNLNDGDDTLSIFYSSIATKLTVDGGNGFDTVTLTGNSIAKQTITNVP